MKLIFYFLLISNLCYSQNHIFFDTIRIDGDFIYQINTIDSLARTVYQKNFNWNGNKKSEGHLGQFDSIKAINLKNHLGVNLNYLVSYYINQTNWNYSDSIPHLFKIGEWKYYDSSGNISKTVVYDSCISKTTSIRAYKQIGKNIGPWPGMSKIEILPLKITYFHKNVKYRDEYYGSGLLYKSWEWDKKP